MTVIDTSESDETLDQQEPAEEEDFLPRAKERPGALTLSLTALLVASLGFLGGIMTQKHTGTSSSGRSGTNSGFNAANFAGGSGTGRNSQGGAAVNAANAATNAAGAGGGTDTPAVIGTLVSASADTAIVKNLAGKQVTVHLNPDTILSKAAAATDLQPGNTVTVTGSSEADGSITATSVRTK